MKKRMVVGMVAVAAVSVLSAEPSANAIRWVDGTWDESGAPKGKMLTPNEGWWGDRVKTDVTYTYENWMSPQQPKDWDDWRKKANVRLFSGQHLYRAVRERWDSQGYEKPAGFGLTSVGSPEGKVISAIFDFKREMLFNEIDVFAKYMTNGVTSIAFSPDKKTWTVEREEPLVPVLNRYRFGSPARGRYLRLRFVGKKGPVRVNSVIAWGDAADGRDGYEDIPAINAGDVMKFTNVTAKGVAILPMSCPKLAPWAKPKGTTPAGVSLRMARDESETRYFAIVNASSNETAVAVSAPNFGAGVTTELLIGGVVLAKCPPKRLSAWDKFQLATTNDVIHADTRDGDYGVRPFLPAGAMPGKSNLRRYFANAEQLAGFPHAVPVRPGEGFILMLRMKTEKTTAAGLRAGVLTADGAKLPIALDVVDLTLPPQRWLVSCYANFTSQFPYETRARFVKDVERYRATGSQSVQHLPEPGTKEEYFFRHDTNAVVIADEGLWLPKKICRQVRAGKFSLTNEAQMAVVAESLHAYARRIGKTGYPMERFVTRVMDEPSVANMASAVACASAMKAAEPKMKTMINPCSTKAGGGSATQEELAACLEGLPYHEVIDLSVPCRTIAWMPKLKDKLFATNHVNACYWLPAAIFSASSAYGLHDMGLNGWRYFAYSEMHMHEPFDIRTSATPHANYTIVYPMEHDVAITAQYEAMRECAEGFRLIRAIEEADDVKRYRKLRRKYHNMVDRARDFGSEEDRKRPDFLAFRDELLKKYSTGK